MIRRILLKIRQLINVLLDERPSETSHQQKVTVVGDNNIIITNGNAKPKIIIPKTKINVKHFRRKNSKKCRVN